MKMYKKSLLVLLATLAFGTSTMCQNNNIVYPYNPDIDTDGYISTLDEGY